MKQKALNYLGRASIIPLNGKIPAIKSWKEFQSRKPTNEEVENWWTTNPKYNIGIVTGKISNLTVVDIDQEERPEWLPPTLVVKTGKGWHYYYQYCEGVNNSARIKENIDIRSEGGYVVGAGSVHPDTGKVYEVIDKNPIAQFPDHLFEVKKERTNWDEMANGAPQGQRNESAAKYIGKLMKMFSRDTWENTVWETALIWNQKNNPPLSEYELRLTYNSIAGREVSKPPVKVLNSLGGDVMAEASQYPLNKLELLTTTNKKGDLVYNLCTENIFRILQNHPDFKGHFRYDEWTQKMELLKGDKWVSLEDSHFIQIQCHISAMYGDFRMVTKDMVINGIYKACFENSFDQAVDYLKGLPAWDGIGRIDDWLSYTYETPNDDYHIAVGSNFFKGMVKRILHPGCKFDTVLILEGLQGCGKSTSFSVIAGAWHLETTMHADTKDFLLQFRGKLIVEFSEGETLSRTETKNMKALISTPTDTYRPPYGREIMDVPRRCVFAMTTNQGEYLKDETGNRRFYPVEVAAEKVNLEWLIENRDQLFAEAMYRTEVLKEGAYKYPESSSYYQQEKMVRSSYENAILTWLEKPTRNGVVVDIEQGVIVDDIWEYALKADISKMRKTEEMQIALALKQFGWEKKRTMVNGIQKSRWYKDGKYYRCP